MTTLQGGTAPLALPSDLPGAAGEYSRAVRRIVIDRRIVDRLEAAARARGATLFMAMMACLKILLYRHTAQSDICVGTPVSSRQQPELERQIGPYLNILALRDSVSGEDSVASVLHRVRDTTLNAFAHQHYPFDRVVQDLKLKRTPGKNPLFDVGFTLQNQLDVQARPHSRHLRLTELSADDASFEDPEAATDIWVVARRDDGDLMLQVVYNGARFSPDRVDRLSEDLLAIVSAGASSPDTKIKAVALTAPDRVPAGRTVTIDLGF